MSLVALKDPGITLDGVAGMELANLEAWVVEWFSQYAKPIFKTIDRYRGQFREEGSRRESFTTPALYLTVTQTRGTGRTRGGFTEADVEFAGVVVAKQSAKARLGQPKGRYESAVWAASAMMRLLHVMEPNDPDQCVGGWGPRQNWARPDRIQFQNIYSEAIDKQGLAMIEFRWVHTLHVAALNVNCLEDLLSITGQIFPNDDTSQNVPVTSETTFTP